MTHRSAGRDEVLQNESPEEQKAKGRHADSPTEIPARGWWEILKRTWAEAGKDNISIVAAGVAFLGLLALFPAMAATVSIYGLIADPSDIDDHLRSLGGFLPGDMVDVLAGQLDTLATANTDSLSFGLLLSLAVALWSAAGGVKSLMTALNIAFEEEEKRGFIKFTLTALVLTLGFIMLMIISIGVVIAIPAALNFIGIGETLEWVVRIARWPLLAIALTAALAVIFRYGPCRAKPQWKWVSWGAGAAVLLWMLASVGFSIYISNFADYNKTYGSLGAGVIMLLWLYIGAYAILLGAELDSEMERQTAKDTTDGPGKPLGERGAFVADTVAK
ncbi:MAG TPA: YihY/virulence factor BrkB family protein [Azospirillaceae bacterium]|nr:YihY/virulence factor BrkB family protein [Azospirillaceae bacterium]